MANQVFNIGLGRVAELYNRVNISDPTNAVLTIIILDSADTDAAVKDVATVAALLALGSTAEVTNTNYARIELTDSDIVAYAPDNANDRVDLDIPDQTFTSIGAGDSWTDLAICYDDDSTGGTDANIVPMTWHDFVVVPNGGDITAQISVDGFYRAS